MKHAVIVAHPNPQSYTATEGAFLSCVVAAADNPAAVPCAHAG